MKRFKLALSDNPVFETITGLTNTTFDSNNIVGGRMATEAQIKALWEDINVLEQRVDYCCRDIVVWKTYTRIIAEDSGIVISDWLENAVMGTTRRGVPFTVEFSPTHDSSKYLDNRSSYSIYRQPYIGSKGANFTIAVNNPGSVNQVESNFLTKAVGQSADGVAPQGGSQDAGTFGYNNPGWTYIDNITKIIIWETFVDQNVEVPTKPLPQLSSDGYYYAYKDTDNKIKIDVRRRDQYTINEYLALFFTQFVLKKELAG